jgi:hypothetical protein
MGIHFKFHHLRYIVWLIFIFTSCENFMGDRDKKDFIIAGISDGLDEIKFNPPKTVSVLNTVVYPDTFSIDINDDEKSDILLISDGYLSHGGMLAVSYVMLLNSNTYLALSADCMNVISLNLGDTINKHLFERNEINTKHILSYYHSDSSPQIEGEWINDSIRYMGIYLKNENKFAWCKLSVQGYKDITLFSYAIQTHPD